MMMTMKPNTSIRYRITHRIAVVKRALLSCFPIMLEKKKLYIAPRKGLVIEITSPRIRVTAPERTSTASRISRIMGAYSTSIPGR